MKKTFAIILALLSASVLATGCSEVKESGEFSVSPQVEQQAADTESGSGATSSQENAIESAESYLDFSAFSESGLVGQLKYEGFSKSDAQYAVSHMSVDWNEQAAKSAADYLDYSSFSESGLIDQLEYEGFTQAQAEYGVAQVYK